MTDSIISRINAIDSIDVEQSINSAIEIGRELLGCDMVLKLCEGFEEPEDSDYFSSIEYYIDFAKLHELENSWYYICSIIRNILQSIAKGSTYISYGSSHKYSFMDTLFDDEIERVKPLSLNDFPIIEVHGSLWH